ncbi:galactose-1-phosphate uridylyltransferase [Marinitenerispora sediminis]|uniref:Galactose-1-phosphate uridylyltransferase n=1 Tax=Marinitenerispora sediminis TaxID=1931232 RepID=A0A368T3U5_9ACTN|nr:galactose-1-phosphate uridylyltransferase [Marinitenerispora sediminis]RCV49661.1 galactose-1-phosphate uridylyltransferase [Marinitenerispora sediminis]RCV53188.1 galactose-1-phosphate uridylyltransferase [Marinitenerispora sediminis]RCV57312.1 galactose-1-phosphate uridylyltransferase [Marinitenerispora sediminis]
MWRSSGRLADGRQIIYFDETPDTGRAKAPDRRPLPPAAPSSQLRRDPLLDDWVVLAAHRQDRTFLPPPDECPLDPTRGDRLTEIPADDYDVVVFENRFPSLATPAVPAPEPPTDPAVEARPGTGRCELVCFTSDHTASFADLTPRRARTVIEAWADRTAELSAMPEVAHVYPFENRGEEIGVTLHHPHGQIYGFPFPPPRIRRMAAAARRHREHTGGNLFDDAVAAERAAGVRVVVETGHWTAIVPAAARWPYEVRLFPRRRVPGLHLLDGDQRDDLAGVYLALLRAFDRLFPAPAPYIAAWHQAPVDAAGTPDPEFGLHLQLFTLRRAAGKLKYLAGSESGMEAWINDISPEDAAHRLRAALGPVPGGGADHTERGAQ